MADQRFSEELHGRSLDVDNSTWHIEVLSMLTDGGRRWMQINVQGPTSVHVLVNAALSRSPGDVVAAIEKRLNEEIRRAIPLGEVLVID